MHPKIYQKRCPKMSISVQFVILKWGTSRTDLASLYFTSQIAMCTCFKYVECMDYKKIVKKLMIVRVFNFYCSIRYGRYFFTIRQVWDYCNYAITNTIRQFGSVKPLPPIGGLGSFCSPPPQGAVAGLVIWSSLEYTPHRVVRCII